MCWLFIHACSSPNLVISARMQYIKVWISENVCTAPVWHGYYDHATTLACWYLYLCKSTIYRLISTYYTATEMFYYHVHSEQHQLLWFWSWCRWFSFGGRGRFFWIFTTFYTNSIRYKTTTHTLHKSVMYTFTYMQGQFMIMLLTVALCVAMFIILSRVMANLVDHDICLHFE